jgi:hypothetical protein
MTQRVRKVSGGAIDLSAIREDMAKAKEDGDELELDVDRASAQPLVQSVLEYTRDCINTNEGRVRAALADTRPPPPSTETPLP